MMPIGMWRRRSSGCAVGVVRLLLARLPPTEDGSVAFSVRTDLAPVRCNSRRPFVHWDGYDPIRRAAAANACGDPTGAATANVGSTKTVTILQRGRSYVVVAKPPSVVCHHSGWTGSRAKAKRGEEPEVPMLQRVRDALGRRVNLIHRLDRGASGALLMAYADDEEGDLHGAKTNRRSATAILSEALASPLSTKTYVALVRGEGILHGTDLKEEGWFAVDRPIKDEKGMIRNATTFFRFVAGQSAGPCDQPRATLVLARPLTGRWHQVRRHLNGLSHPILGDSTHGSSSANQEWKQKRNMPGERTCLHLARLTVSIHQNATAGDVGLPPEIDVTCPLPDDMLSMMERYMPHVLASATPILEHEGIIVRPNTEGAKFETLSYEVNDLSSTTHESN